MKMQRLIAAVVSNSILASGATALADPAQNVTYVRGTVQTLKEGTSGTMDKTSLTALAFQSGDGQIHIPFAQITSFRYKEESAIHVGVLGAIVVGLLRPWPKRHSVTIIWKGDSDVPQVATFEADKSIVDGLLEVMRARATEPCRPGQRGVPPASCGTRDWE